MNILLLGSSGMLGSYLYQYLKNQAYNVYTLSHADLDLTIKEDVFSKLDNIKFDILINSAAYTDVLEAENKVDLAYAVNYIAVQNLVDYLNSKGGKQIFIHFSTDYVFSGKNDFAYAEDSDDFYPTTVYGRSKLAGEEYLRSNYNNYYLFRISSLFADEGNNFPKTMLDLARKYNELSIVSDQFSCPSYVPDVLESVFNILDNKKEFGVYHIINTVDDLERGISWYEFARDIFKEAGISIELKKTTLSEYFKDKIQKPKRTVLKNTKVAKLAHYKDALKRFIQNQNKNK